MRCSSFPLCPRPAPQPLTAAEVRRRLDSPRTWAALGLHPEDLADLNEQLEDLSDQEVQTVASASAVVLGLIGTRLQPAPQTFFDSLPAAPSRPPGWLALLTLAACAAEVIDFGTQHGVTGPAAGSGVRDLGQQVHVYRLATGEFGLVTQWWLTLPWSGNLWWLGRLQYNVVSYRGEYWLSVHIPQTGPLRGVEDSFRAARSFAAEHLRTLPIAGLHCDSWLLDPHLRRGLGPASNISRFAARWTLQEGAREASTEALFFTFHRHARCPPEELPRRTRLERVVADRIQAGESWHSPVGLLRWTDPT